MCGHMTSCHIHFPTIYMCFPIKQQNTKNLKYPLLLLLATRAKAKKQAQVQLLETIPENLLSESDDDEYSLLDDLQAALADNDFEDDEVDNELPNSDEEIEEK